MDLMSRGRLAGVVMLAALMAEGPTEAQPGPGGPPAFVSPEVAADGTVTFRLWAPNATEASVTGGDLPQLGMGQAMKKGDNGVWSLTVGPVAPGAYRYRFGLSGVDVLDPRNGATSESNGNAWSLLVVPGSAISDLRNVPHGAVAEIPYWSAPLGRFRRMHVYTPPGYEAGQDHYPVLYLLHGAFDCDDSWSTVGRAGLILDNLIAAGKARPMIVAMPAGHTGPFSFGGPRPAQSGPRRDEFMEDFVGAVRPLVEERYRVIADREHRAIAGLSMGGMQTLDIAFGALADYSYVGVFSSGIFGLGGGNNPFAPSGPSWEERHADVLADAYLRDGLRLMWFATGREDFLLNTTQATVKLFQDHGFTVTYTETEGGHTWTNWRQYLSDFAPLLFLNG